MIISTLVLFSISIQRLVVIRDFSFYKIDLCLCDQMYKIWKNLGVGENAKKLGKKAAAELKYRKPFEAGKKEI